MSQPCEIGLKDELRPDAYIPLSDVPREPDVVAAAEASGRRPPRYRMLYSRVIDGDLPAQRIGRVWHVARKDLPLIIERLGLTPGRTARSPKARGPRAAAVLSANPAI